MKLREILKDLDIDIKNEENINISNLFCSLDEYNELKKIQKIKNEENKINPKEILFILKNTKYVIKNGEKKYLTKTVKELYEEIKNILLEKIAVIVLDENKINKKEFTETFNEIISFNKTKVIFVKEINNYEGIIASHFFETPSIDLKVIGVYGDKYGKYISKFLEGIYLESNIPAALINERKENLRSAVDFQGTLSHLKKSGVKTVIINASAQSLNDGMFMGTFFEAGVFGDISEEEKYWKQNFENLNDYLNSVLKLFMYTKYNIINNDDYASDYVKNINPNNYTFGIVNRSTYNATDVNIRAINTNYLVLVGGKVERIGIRMHGMDLVYSSLAALTYGLSSGLNFINIKNSLEHTYIPYKKEMLENDLELQILLDETVDPEEIDQILKDAKKLVTGRITVVISRDGLDIYDDLPIKIDETYKLKEDKEKLKEELKNREEKIKRENKKEIEDERKTRKRLGEVLSKHADIGIITTGSSKFENQNQIIREIEEGVNKKKTKVFKYLDRKEALISSMYNIQQRDLVAIFGISDEKLDIKGKKEFIDQKQILKNYLEENREDIKLR